MVLKGHRTVVADSIHLPAINSSGSPALATAGTGDVLAGMIAAFLAQNMDSYDAARSAVFIHGLTAELSDLGMRGLIADDLLELLPFAMKEISPFA